MRLRAALLVGLSLVACDGRGVVPPDAPLTVDPLNPGPAELPGEPLPEPFPWRTAAIIGLVAVAASAWLVRRAWPRRATVAQPAAAPAAPAPRPEERALAALERLRARRPRERSETDAFYVEASAVVRGYVGERFGLATERMTTEECLDASRVVVGRTSHATLADLLRHCDDVKFALHAPSDVERSSMLDRAAAFVRETAAVRPWAAP